MIDAGVPRWERDRVPLLEAGGDIIWVAGLRRGRAAPVRDGTRRILEVTLRSPLAGHATEA
jgi:tRNA(Ile)-lysidine synthase